MRTGVLLVSLHVLLSLLVLTFVGFAAATHDWRWAVLALLVLLCDFAGAAYRLARDRSRH